MALFKYKAADSEGKTVDFIIEGDSQQDSLGRLRKRGMLPLEFIGEVSSKADTGSKHFWKRGGFDVCDFTNRLVPLMKASIPLERSLGIISEGMNDQESKEVVNELRKGLHEGKKFSDLIRRYSNIFPNIFANVVEAGEEIGAVGSVIEELQRFLNARREMKNFLISSLIYPVILLSVTILVCVLMFGFVLPRFAKIFDDMGKKMPLFTHIMISIGDILTGLWPLWLILIAGLCYFFTQVSKGGQCKIWWDKNVLKVPLLGDMLKIIEINRFIKTLCILIANHVKLLDTIEIASRVITNTHIAATFRGISSELRGGISLSAALMKSPFMPKLALQMLRIGEESGQVPEMLQQVGKHYEEQVRMKTQRFLALLGPLVIIFLAALIFTVVLAIFLAIIEIDKM